MQTGADGRKIDIPASLGQGFQSTESRTLMQARKLFEKVMGGVSFQSKDMQWQFNYEGRKEFIPSMNIRLRSIVINTDRNRSCDRLR